MKQKKKRGNIWSKDFWISKGMSEIDAIEKVRIYQSTNAKKRDYKKSPSILNINFWISKGMSEIDAIEKVRIYQSNNSKKSKKFTGKSHTFESKLKISNSMKQYISSIGNDNIIKRFGDFTINFRSRGEVKLYNYIVRELKFNVVANKFILGFNVDICFGNKIIEYFGDYWHGNKLLFDDENIIHPHKKCSISDIRNYDNNKINILKDNGYQVLIIWETDFYKHENETKERIKKFLNDT